MNNKTKIRIALDKLIASGTPSNPPKEPLSVLIAADKDGINDATSLGFSWPQIAEAISTELDRTVAPTTLRRHTRAKTTPISKPKQKRSKPKLIRPDTN